MFTVVEDFNQQSFTVTEAAEYLRILRAMFYSPKAANKLKPFKVGTRILFLGAELDRFVQSVQGAA